MGQRHRSFQSRLTRQPKHDIIFAMNPNPCKECGGVPVQQCVDGLVQGIFVVACEKCESQCESLVSMENAIEDWDNHNPISAGASWPDNTTGDKAMADVRKAMNAEQISAGASGKPDVGNPSPPP